MSFSFIQHKTIDSVLARGEKLDSLVEKSSDLSAASQVRREDLCYHYALAMMCKHPFTNTFLLSQLV